jgi:hypothetical protein
MPMPGETLMPKKLAGAASTTPARPNHRMGFRSRRDVPLTGAQYYRSHRGYYFTQQLKFPKSAILRSGI